MTTLKKGESFDRLNPPYDSSLRKSTLNVSVFNLFASICGGGVLTLPLAFSVAGIIPTTLILIFAAYINDFGLFILCICARKIGGKTYMDVTRTAYGIKAEIFTTFVLFIELSFSLVAYMVLAQDIWTPIALSFFPKFESFILFKLGDGATQEALVKEAGHYVLVFILLLVSPLLFKKDLYALRHACYVGFGSLVVLTFSLVYKAYEKNFVEESRMFSDEIKWWSWNIGDWIFAFPIVGLSFLCSYNILSVQGALIEPSRKRVKTMLFGSHLLCLCFYWIVGVSGYLYAYSNTEGNIFLNFPSSDKAMFLGRLGYGVTIVLALPVVLLPNREALLTFPSQWNELMQVMKEMKYTGHTKKTMDIDEETPLTKNTDPDECYNCCDKSNEVHLTNSKVAMTPPDIPHPTFIEKESQSSEFIENVAHFTSSILLVIICYYGAVAVPGVAIVWSIIGSSNAIILAFILPCMCYIKLRGNTSWTPVMIGTWALLIFSIITAFVCTIQTMGNL